MSSAKGERGTNASLDARLRAIDEQIAAVELPRIPKPAGRDGDVAPAIESLVAQVEQLCTQRAVNVRELNRWSVEAELAVRENDDVRAKAALVRHAEHLRLAQEADALLVEFRLLIADVQRSLAEPDGPAEPPTPSKAMLGTGVSLAYVDLGPRSSDALVLLPGLSDSWRSYELVLPHLPATFRTIAVSPRGHGDSDKPVTGYTVRDFTADLNALVDALAIRRVVIAGHSSASTVARRFALDHPDKTVGLVLEASFLKLGASAAQFMARLESLEDPVSREFARDFASETFGRSVSQEFVEAMIEESLKVPARVWRETFDSLLHYDDSVELSKLDVATLLVWGDKDAIIDRAATETLARSIRGSTLVVYEGVGHTPHWEDPARFAHDVAAFVRSQSSANR